MFISVRNRCWATRTAGRDSAAGSAGSKGSDPSPWGRCVASPPTPAATSPCSRSSTPTMRPRWMAMRFPAGSETPCSSACRPAGPHQGLPAARPRRTAGSNRHPQPRPADPLRTQNQNPPPPAAPTTRTRSLAMATTPPGAYLVTNAGTHTPGDGPFARQLWRAATPAKRRPISAA
jgi:hypothetical protein